MNILWENVGCEIEDLHKYLSHCLYNEETHYSEDEYYVPPRRSSHI